MHADEETIIDRFFGDTDWRKVYEKYHLKEPSTVHKHLIDYYKSKLVALGYEDIKDVEDYESAEPIMRNTRQAPLYRLIFASKHKKGHDFWKEVIRKNVARTNKFLVDKTERKFYNAKCRFITWSKNGAVSN